MAVELQQGGNFESDLEKSVNLEGIVKLAVKSCYMLKRFISGILLNSGALRRDVFEEVTYTGGIKFFIIGGLRSVCQFTC